MDCIQRRGPSTSLGSPEPCDVNTREGSQVNDTEHTKHLRSRTLALGLATVNLLALATCLGLVLFPFNLKSDLQSSSGVLGMRGALEAISSGRDMQSWVGMNGQVNGQVKERMTGKAEEQTYSQVHGKSLESNSLTTTPQQQTSGKSIATSQPRQQPRVVSLKKEAGESGLPTPQLPQEHSLPTPYQESKAPLAKTNLLPRHLATQLPRQQTPQVPKHQSPQVSRQQPTQVPRQQPTQRPRQQRTQVQRQGGIHLPAQHGTPLPRPGDAGTGVRKGQWLEKGKCSGYNRGTVGIPGSALKTAAQAWAFRALMHCISTRGRWVLNPTPRPLPWRYGMDLYSYTLCDTRHTTSAPGGISHADADRVASQKGAKPATWRVREDLKYVWRVKPGVCRGLPKGLTLDPGGFRPTELCHVLSRGSAAPPDTVMSADAERHVNSAVNSAINSTETTVGLTSRRFFRKVVLVGDSLQSQMALSLASMFQMGQLNTDKNESREEGVLAPLTMPCHTTMIGNSSTVHYNFRDASLKFCFGRQICENVPGPPAQVSTQLLFLRSDHLGVHNRTKPDDGPGGSREIHMPWLEELVSPRPLPRKRGQGHESTRKARGVGGVEEEYLGFNVPKASQPGHRAVMESAPEGTAPSEGTGPETPLGKALTDPSDGMLSPVIVFNTGAHVWGAQKMLGALCETLVETRRRCPSCLIVFRSTSGGHSGCTKMTKPLEKRPNLTDRVSRMFGWDRIVRQTQQARALVESVGGVFLDVEPMTSLRGDGHVGSAPGVFRRPPDCLHYCAPGPMDFWSLLLEFALNKLL